MPIYEYVCHVCEKEFEVSQRIVDPPLQQCPHCHQSKVERLISQTSFSLKGSGWYKDGYGSSGSSSSSTTKAKESTSSKKEESTSGDGKSVSASSDKTVTK